MLFAASRQPTKHKHQMRATAQIINERSESYQGKRGVVKQQIACCLDTDPEHPFLNTFDFTLSDDEIVKFSGKLTGKRVEIAITNMDTSFAGRIRARGTILKLLNA